MKKTFLEKQIYFWKTYGILSPLVFAVGLIIAYWLNWFDVELWMLLAGIVAGCTAVVWWWWTMFTIGKLNNTLTKNVEQFLELLNIVKDLNHEFKEQSSSNRKRGKPEADKNKSIKE